jgi:hypothetical protein
MEFAKAMIVGYFYAATQIDILPDGQMVSNFFGASSKKSLWRQIKLVCRFGLIL